jgi:hypothetical protein
MQAVVMRRTVRLISEVVSITGGAALAGIGCCGPILLLWLGQLLFTLGGAAALLFLIRYEAAVSLAVAAGAWLGWWLASDRLSRAAAALLGTATLLNALARFGWDRDPQPIMAIPPLYWAFSYRQVLLGLVLALVLALQVAALARAVSRGRVRQAPCALATGEEPA